jgi:hypothetical protein
MVDLPTTTLPDIRDQESSSRLAAANSASSVVDDDSASTASMQSSVPEVVPFDSPQVGRVASSRLRGHLCAAGCGHFCWAASGEVDDF